MAPLFTLDAWNVRTPRPERSPKSKCFLIGEGANTEYRYLSRLTEILAKRNLPALIELKPVRKTENERNQSNPAKLLEHAQRIRSGKATEDCPQEQSPEIPEQEVEFEEGVDSIIVFFDADIYKDRPNDYRNALASFEGVADVAVTNPSFELFLLLHADDALESAIMPQESEILANKKTGNRRFVEKLASEVLGMNTKSNPKVADLAERFEIAAEAEKRLNQNPQTALGNLTSNVALRINEVIAAGESA